MQSSSLCSRIGDYIYGQRYTMPTRHDARELTAKYVQRSWVDYHRNHELYFQFPEPGD